MEMFILVIVDINEFMRGFILTTKGDMQSKIDYTFRLYDTNGDNQISGGEIKKMADVNSSEISFDVLLLSLYRRLFCAC